MNKLEFLLVCSTSILLIATKTAFSAELTESLYSGPSLSTEDQASGCVIDPSDIGKEERIRRVLHYLNLDDVAIIYVGCAGRVFKVVSSGGRDEQRRRVFKVYYPLQMMEMDDDSYLAPIIHELSHVYQAKPYGSIGQLKDTILCSERVELGADFITGFIFKNLLDEESVSLFQSSVDLLGGYNRTAHDSHATPDDRTMSFRRGYAFTRVSGISDLDQAYAYFQAQGFSELVRDFNHLKGSCK